MRPGAEPEGPPGGRRQPPRDDAAGAALCYAARVARFPTALRSAGALALGLALCSSGGRAGALVWPSQIEALKADLASEDASVVAAAVTRIPGLPSAMVAELLPSLFDESDPEVLLALAQVTLKLHPRGAGKRVAHWLGHRDVRLRAAALEVLQALPDPEAAPAVARALGDAKPSVRIGAARALALTGGDVAVSALLGQLDDTDANVRREVIAGLATIVDARAVVPLLGKMQDQQPEIRREAADALGAIGDARAISSLTVALADSDAEVRAAAARALGRLAASPAIWALQSLAESEAEPNATSAALVALGRIGSADSLAALLHLLSVRRMPPGATHQALAAAGERAAATVEQCLARSSLPESIRVECLEAVDASANREGVLKLARAALGQGPALTTSAISLLGRSGGDAELPLVLEQLLSPEVEARAAAIAATEELLARAARPGSTVRPIVAALERRECGLSERIALVRLLGLTRSPRAQVTLLTLTAASHLQLRIAAVEALGLLGRDGADAALLEALDSDSDSMRWAAASSLRQAGGAEAAAPLIALILSAPAASATTAAVALAGPLRSGVSSEQLSSLLSGLERLSGPTRDAVVEALGFLPSAQAAEWLDRLAAHPDSWTRSKVAESLAEHQGAEPTLLRLLGDPEARVRANAAWSLGGSTSRASLEALSKALTDDSAIVASNAVASLGRAAASVSEGNLPQAIRRALCKSLDSTASYVVANALHSIRQARAPCDSANVVRLLAHHHSEQVRLAAARFLASSQPLPEAARAALRRCVNRDMSGAVAETCLRGLEESGATAEAPPGAPAPPTASAHRTSVLVMDPGHASPTPSAPFSLATSGGWIRSGFTDRRGSVLATSREAADVSLVQPCVFDI